jgi:LPXTG-site transpeptidase (sortase) family protein
MTVAAENAAAPSVEGWLDASASSAPAAAEATATEPPSPPVENTPDPVPAPEVAAAPALAVPVAPLAPAAVPRPPSNRIRIPSIGIDAPLATLGITAGGVMEAPRDAFTVGWYHFSAEPGAPGNALMSGHYDLGTSTAVFWHLQSLNAGDVITVASGGTEFTYVVESSYSVPYNTENVAPIVGVRSGRSTLTLITCDGAFNRAMRRYEERLVVVAALRA